MNHSKYFSQSKSDAYKDMIYDLQRIIKQLVNIQRLPKLLESNLEKFIYLASYYLSKHDVFSCYFILYYHILAIKFK